MVPYKALVDAISAALASTDDLPDPAPATSRNGTSEPSDPQMYLSIYTNGLKTFIQCHLHGNQNSTSLQRKELAVGNIKVKGLHHLQRNQNSSRLQTEVAYRPALATKQR